MLGTIMGDIIGSRFEFMATKERNVELFHPACSFTDDTVCCSAVSMATNVLQEHLKLSASTINFTKSDDIDFTLKIYSKTMQQVALKYPMAGYGKMFMHWLTTGNREPYNSLGNGALMRISTIILYARSLEEALYFSNLSASISHNHPETLLCVNYYIQLLWDCKIWNGTPEELKTHLKNKIQTFNLNILSVEKYHELGGFYVLSKDTLERALAAFLESSSLEETIRNVLYIGSDTDTTAAIASPFAEMTYGIPFSWFQKITPYFNHISIELLQSIINPYLSLSEQTLGKLSQKTLLDNKVEWYKETFALVLEDPTAAWDPLGDIDDQDYYSEADIALQKSHNTFLINLLKRIGLMKKP